MADLWWDIIENNHRDKGRHIPRRTYSDMIEDYIDEKRLEEKENTQKLKKGDD